MQDHTTPTPGQANIDSVTLAMRETLGVDAVTGLDLADAVKVGMLLGSMLRQPDGEHWPVEVTAAFYAEEISDREHAILVEAVADILSLRTGQKARRTEEAMLAYYLGFASCARLAEDFGPRSLPVTLKDVGEHFTADEMGELMSALERVIAHRRGEAAAVGAPGARPALGPVRGRSRRAPGGGVTTIQHQPWCVYHDEKVCLSESTDNVIVTWAPGEPVTVWVDGPDGMTEVPLTIEAAQRAARAILHWFPDGR